MELTTTKSLSNNSLKILVYGHSGVGKTTLASTINESVLIVSAESGLLSIADHDIPVVDITCAPTALERYQKLIEVYQYLKLPETQEKYDWIFIDSLTEIAQTLVQSLKQKYTDRKDGLVLWGEYNEKIRSLIKAFRDLKGYHVVFTALQAANKDEIGKRFNGIDMPGSISSSVEAFFDEVFNLQIHETEIDEEVVEKRVLLTSRTDRTVGKDRSGKLNMYEPCDLNHIKNKILGGN